KMEAYTLYLRGRFHWNRRTKADLERAIAFFQQAIELEPRYAQAYAGLADAWYILVSYGLADAKEFLPKAEEAARRALELDDALAEAHTSLAGIAAYRFDWEQAERGFRRAIELNPNYATAHHWYAFLLSTHGRLDEALGHIHRARELDPHSPIIWVAAAVVHHWTRQYDRILDEVRATVQLHPGALPEFHMILGAVLFWLGRYEEALSELQKYQEQEARMAPFTDCFCDILSALAHERMGKRGVLRKTLDRWEAEPDRRKISSYSMAIGYFQLGDMDRGFEWLERASEYEMRRGVAQNLINLKADPFFDAVRDDPRFQRILAKLGLTG
ncbi:MAG: tetratricopeptide repeat protein, partial [Candidatus Bipolaricaulota bacterium]